MYIALLWCCFQPLGASDYLEMARLFDTVFIRHVPVLSLKLKDQARRFTILVDNFYDNKVFRGSVTRLVPFYPM